MNLITLDFESIPDVDLAEYLTDYTCPDSPDGHDIAVDTINRISALQSYLKKKNGDESDDDPFFPAYLQKIVTAGIHLAEIRFGDGVGEWYETKHLSSTAENEEKVVTDLIGYFSRMLPRFVTYNGRHFDMPLLVSRALKYRVPMPYWFNVQDKWDNYTSRYAPDKHFDILDFISDHGATTRIKLHEFMAILRLPHKTNQGSEVMNLYLNNEMEQARSYCEVDCMNQFLCYVNCQLLRGAIQRQGYEMSMYSAVKFLVSNYAQKHLKEFHEEWCSLDPFISKISQEYK